MQGISQAPVQALAGEGDSLLSHEGGEPGDDLLAEPSPPSQKLVNGSVLLGEGHTIP
jgi:hypothetical protein